MVLDAAIRAYDEPRALEVLDDIRSDLGLQVQDDEHEYRELPAHDSFGRRASGQVPRRGGVRLAFRRPQTPGQRRRHRSPIYCLPLRPELWPLRTGGPQCAI
jgi:hypothetical protein